MHAPAASKKAPRLPWHDEKALRFSNRLVTWNPFGHLEFPHATPAGHSRLCAHGVLSLDPGALR